MLRQAHHDISSTMFFQHFQIALFETFSFLNYNYVIFDFVAK